jgi:hypothetical protein
VTQVCGMMELVRPEAIVFLVIIAIIVLFAVIKRLTRTMPVDERRDHPFPYAPVQYVFGAVFAAVTLVAAGVGWLFTLGGRVVANAWHRGQHKTA